MARVTRVNNSRDSRHVLFRTSERFLESYDDHVFNVQRKGREYSQRFLDKVDRMREKSSRNRAMLMARSSIRKLRNRGRVDAIIELNSVEDFRNATLKMQNVIMSHERTRREWQSGRIAGFELGYNSNPSQRHARKHSLTMHRMLNDRRPQRDESDEAVVHQYARTYGKHDEMSEHDKAVSRLTHVRIDDLWNGEEDFTSQANNLL